MENVEFYTDDDVSEILGVLEMNNQLYFKVNWFKFPPFLQEWIPLSQLLCPSKISEFIYSINHAGDKEDFEEKNNFVPDIDLEREEYYTEHTPICPSPDYDVHDDGDDDRTVMKEDKIGITLSDSSGIISELRPKSGQHKDMLLPWIPGELMIKHYIRSEMAALIIQDLLYTQDSLRKAQLETVNKSIRFDRFIQIIKESGKIAVVDSNEYIFFFANQGYFSCLFESTDDVWNGVNVFAFEKKHTFIKPYKKRTISLASVRVHGWIVPCYSVYHERLLSFLYSIPDELNQKNSFTYTIFGPEGLFEITEFSSYLQRCWNGEYIRQFDPSLLDIIFIHRSYAPFIHMIPNISELKSFQKRIRFYVFGKNPYKMVTCKNQWKEIFPIDSGGLVTLDPNIFVHEFKESIFNTTIQNLSLSPKWSIKLPTGFFDILKKYMDTERHLDKAKRFQKFHSALASFHQPRTVAEYLLPMDASIVEFICSAYVALMHKYRYFVLLEGENSKDHCNRAIDRVDCEFLLSILKCMP